MKDFCLKLFVCLELLKLILSALKLDDEQYAQANRETFVTCLI